MTAKQQRLPLSYHTDSDEYPRDWGEASVAFDNLLNFVQENEFLESNEAETRLKIIDKKLFEKW
ncbi:MAG: hypothetical protein L0154_07770 [Chloroflexi bacterium]|nr:hypothetical protein [Chloroflexota bacterium]